MVLRPLDGKVSFRRVGEGLEGDVVMILADVSVRDAEGARALLQFASQGDYRLHLSDLPLELAPLFLKDRPPDANPRLLSFRVEMACKSCRKTVRLSLDSNRLTLLKTMGTVEEICQACAGPLAPSRPEKLQRISPSPCVAPPPAIRAYLERPREGGATRRPPRGEVLGRYRLGKKIGHGGMAEVFLARQHGPQGFEKRVVVKRLLPALADDKQFVEMFLREARLAARLSHPNIVQIFDLGQSGKTFFIAMEYVRGWDLNAVMKASVATNVRIPLQIACRIMSQVCAGLAYAHRPVDDEGKPMAIVHRDVSPQNILVSDQVVKLTDFGIAKAAGAITGTQPGMIRGKISYMAPEQVTKSGEVDGRVDIFATGVILYELVAGQRLFHRETQAGTLAAVLAGTVPPLSARRPEAVILEPILAKALQPDPNRRYQSADVMQADLEAVITRTGRPAGPAEVGAWLAGLSAAFKDVGGVAPVTSTTPTASAEVRLPTANLRTGTVGPGEDEHTVPSNKRDLERR